MRLLSIPKYVSGWTHGLPFLRSFSLSYTKAQLLFSDISTITVFTVRCVASCFSEYSARHQRICMDSRSTMFAVVHFILHPTATTHARSLSNCTWHGTLRFYLSLCIHTGSSCIPTNENPDQASTTARTTNYETAIELFRKQSPTSSTSSTVGCMHISISKGNYHFLFAMHGRYKLSPTWIVEWNCISSESIYLKQCWKPRRMRSVQEWAWSKKAWTHCGFSFN